jgi:integrase
MTDEIHVYVVQEKDRTNLTMRYVDPVTGRQVKRSAGTSNRKEAERRAAVWQDELVTGRYSRPSKISWEEFRERYEAERLAGLAPKTQKTAMTALNHFERIINPQKLASVTTAALSRFQAELRKPQQVKKGDEIIALPPMKETTLAGILAHLRPAFSWAVSMGMLPKMPEIHKPRLPKGRTLMRGRPISLEEFERMLKAVVKVRPNDKRTWRRYLRGLWLSGLRLEESLILSWDEDLPFSVDLTGRHPRFRIYAEAEKGRRDRLLPMTPDFSKFLLRTPEAQRHGRVFRMDGVYTHGPISPKRISRTISAIGRKAGVIVNKAQGKFASAHDLRRSFGTRWAPRVKPATLQLLMRHQSIETTLKYYVAQDADDVGDELWKSFAPQNKAKQGETSTTAGRPGHREPLH